MVKTRTMTTISLQQTPNNKNNHKKSNNNKRRPSKKEKGNDIVAPLSLFVFAGGKEWEGPSSLLCSFNVIQEKR